MLDSYQGACKLCPANLLMKAQVFSYWDGDKSSYASETEHFRATERHVGTPSSLKLRKRRALQLLLQLWRCPGLAGVQWSSAGLRPGCAALAAP